MHAPLLGRAHTPEARAHMLVADARNQIRGAHRLCTSAHRSSLALGADDTFPPDPIGIGFGRRLSIMERAGPLGRQLGAGLRARLHGRASARIVVDRLPVFRRKGSSRSCSPPQDMRRQIYARFSRVSEATTGREYR